MKSLHEFPKWLIDCLIDNRYLYIFPLDYIRERKREIEWHWKIYCRSRIKCHFDQQFLNQLVSNFRYNRFDRFSKLYENIDWQIDRSHCHLQWQWEIDKIILWKETDINETFRSGFIIESVREENPAWITLTREIKTRERLHICKEKNRWFISQPRAIFTAKRTYVNPCACLYLSYTSKDRACN